MSDKYSLFLFLYAKLYSIKLYFYSKSLKKSSDQLSSIKLRRCDIKIDINPRSWLSKYRQTSLAYITIILLFYHGIGLLFVFMGTFLVERAVSNYHEPSIPRSPISVISAGPIEETLFFGIPYYAFGNHFVILIGGIVWVMIHILNTQTLDIHNLAYANWLFVIPSFFFSFRTWISGKGWFAIITHSAWNGIIFTSGCISEDFSCMTTTNEGNFSLLNLSSLAVSSVLLALTYFLYSMRKQNK